MDFGNLVFSSAGHLCSYAGLKLTISQSRSSVKG